MSDHFPYMTGPSDPGHYEKAFALARKKFRQRSPAEIASAAGVFFDQRKREFIVPSFGTELSVTYPGGSVCFRHSRALPLVGWRLVTINYLARANGEPLRNRPVSYRELQDGNIFYPAFHREAIQKLIQWLPGKSLDLIKRSAGKLGARLTGGADLSFVFPAFPRFPVTLKIWLPDEELPGSATVIFDSTASDYLHTEDIAVIGWYPTAFLIKHYELISGERATGKIIL